MKNNHNFIIILIAIIFVAVGFLVFQDIPEEKTAQSDSKPNVVTQAEKKTQSSGFDQDKWQKEHDKKMARQEQFWLTFLAGREVKAMNSKPSYLEAYRDYIYYDGCIPIISNILNNMDPFLFTLRRNQSFEDLSLAQQQALEGRLNKCLQLTDFSDKTYHEQNALSQLKQRYQAIPPKTDKEQQLAATLKLIDDLNFNNNRVLSLQRGEVIDPQLHVDLMTMRRELQDQIPKPLSFFGGYNEADQSLVDQLRRQIADIDQQILDNKHVDNEEVRAFKAEIKRLVSELQRVVSDTRSSDAYLAVYDLIGEGRLEADIEAVKAQLTGGIQLIPKQYETYLTPILVHFRACELSHPCGPDSLLVEQQCLDFTHEQAPQACHSELIDYYLNHVLSPNQLIDVDYIIKEGY